MASYNQRINKLLRDNGWENKVGELPKDIIDKVIASNGLKWHSNIWLYVKDDKWIMVTDDGGYYKVHAEWMVWHVSPRTGNVLATAIWSVKSLFNNLKAIIETGDSVGDPDYQT